MRFFAILCSFVKCFVSNLLDRKYIWQRWLDYYGPFEAVVDAANVGLFSQRKFKPSKACISLKFPFHCQMFHFLTCVMMFAGQCCCQWYSRNASFNEMAAYHFAQ